jgi:hypothetical protein
MSHPALLAAADQVATAINALHPAAGVQVAARVLTEHDRADPAHRAMWAAVASLLDGVAPAKVSALVSTIEVIGPHAALEVLATLLHALHEVAQQQVT